MKNIETILSEAGVELTDEQRETVTKAVNENYKTVADYEKQTAKRDSYKTQYEEAKAALDKFDGADIEDLKKQIEEAKAAVKAAEENAAAEIAKRDYSDAVAKNVATLKFSSEAAKKAFTADLMEQELKLKDGVLLGFNDYVEAYRKADANAIVDKDAADNAAKFTDPMHQGSTPPNARETAQTNSMRAAMGLPPLKEDK